MKNKFGARKIKTPGGEVFDSAKEYQRWCELLLLERAGKIHGLRRQFKFELIPTQREKSTDFYKAGAKKGIPKLGAVIENSCSYVADFVYYDEEERLVAEDTKGYRGGCAYQLFVIKRKLMLERYGIRVKEIT